MPHVRDGLEEIAHEAAGDALISVLACLDDFRGESRFTTWAYKFAILETAVKLRKRAWQGRELPVPPQRLEPVLERHVRSPGAIDVMADRLDATRGALHKTLHDARGKLREHLEGQDLTFA